MRKTILLAVVLLGSVAAFGQSNSIMSDIDVNDDIDVDPYLFIELDTVYGGAALYFDFWNIEKITKRDSILVSFNDSKTVTVLRYKKARFSKKMIKTMLDTEDIDYLKGGGIEYIMFNEKKFTFKDDAYLITKRANEVF